MNQGTICAKEYPEGVQLIKANNCGLIPFSIRPETTIMLLYGLFIHFSMNLFSQHSRQFILSFYQVFEACETIFSQF